MPSQETREHDLYMMLGEMRGDLKYLVEERRSTNRRLDEVENSLNQKIDEMDVRVGKLESFKIRIGAITGALGVIVPTSITVIAHKLGLLS